MPYMAMRTGEEELVSCGRCYYANDAFLAILTADKFDYPAYFGKERIVSAPADILTRKKSGASLTYQNSSAGHHLAVRRFHAQSL